MESASRDQFSYPPQGYLRTVVTGLLREALGEPVRISGLERRPSPFASLFPAEVLEARLTTGESLTLLAKYLGDEGGDHPNKQYRDREFRVYKELLGDASLPVVRCYGALWIEPTAHSLLLLEYVGDWDLRYQGLEHWTTAAIRLADLHAHFATRPSDLSSCGALLQIDRQYLGFWSRKAAQAVGTQSADLTSKLEGMLSRYDATMELLAQQPPTLVHNDLSPKNVIASRVTTPARICLVDWEMAGMGCGALDLVHLTYGLDPAREQELHSVYRSRLTGTGLLPEDDGEWQRLVAACKSHETLYRLARSPGWNLPLSTLQQWVDEYGELVGQVPGP